jgi:hypothetical protein
MIDRGSIQETFKDNFALRGEVGASVSVWFEGREILGLGSGFQDKAETLPWLFEHTCFSMVRNQRTSGCLCVACHVMPPA